MGGTLCALCHAVLLLLCSSAGRSLAAATALLRLPACDARHLPAAAGPPVPPRGSPPQVLALPTASIEAFIADESMGKSAGLLFSLMWMQERLEAHGGRLFPAAG